MQPDRISKLLSLEADLPQPPPSHRQALHEAVARGCWRHWWRRDQALYLAVADCLVQTQNGSHRQGPV
jgi:hypothetical protein